MGLRGGGAVPGAARSTTTTRSVSSRYVSTAQTFTEPEPITAVGERLGWTVVSMARRLGDRVPLRLGPCRAGHGACAGQGERAGREPATSGQRLAVDAPCRRASRNPASKASPAPTVDTTVDLGRGRGHRLRGRRSRTRRRARAWRRPRAAAASAGPRRPSAASSSSFAKSSVGSPRSTAGTGRPRRRGAGRRWRRPPTRAMARRLAAAHRGQGGRARALAEQRVPGQVEPGGRRRQRGLDDVGAQRVVGAAVGEHRALAGLVDQHHAGAGGHARDDVPGEA